MVEVLLMEAMDHIVTTMVETPLIAMVEVGTKLTPTMVEVLSMEAMDHTVTIMEVVLHIAMEENKAH